MTTNFFSTFKEAIEIDKLWQEIEASHNQDYESGLIVDDFVSIYCRNKSSLFNGYRENIENEKQQIYNLEWAHNSINRNNINFKEIDGVQQGANEVNNYIFNNYSHTLNDNILTNLNQKYIYLQDEFNKKVILDQNAEIVNKIYKVARKEKRKRNLAIIALIVVIVFLLVIATKLIFIPENNRLPYIISLIIAFNIALITTYMSKKLINKVKGAKSKLIEQNRNHEHLENNFIAEYSQVFENFKNNAYQIVESKHIEHNSVIQDNKNRLNEIYEETMADYIEYQKQFMQINPSLGKIYTEMSNNTYDEISNIYNDMYENKNNFLNINECNEYIDNLVELQKTQIKLTDYIKTNQETYSKNQKKFDNNEMELKKLYNTKKELKEEISLGEIYANELLSLKKEKDYIENETTQLKTELKFKNTNLEKYKNQKRNIESKISSFEKQISTLKSEIYSVSRENIEKEELSLIDLRHEKAMIESELQFAESNNEKTQIDDLREISSKIAEVERKIHSERSKYTKALEQKNKSEIKIQSIEYDLDLNNENLQMIKSEIFQLEAEIKNLNQNCRENEGKLDNISRIVKAVNLLEENKKTEKSLIDIINNITNLNEFLELDIFEYEAEVGNFNQKINSLSAKISSKTPYSKQINFMPQETSQNKFKEKISNKFRNPFKNRFKN